LEVLDLTKPIQTRSGRPVRVICTDYKDSTFPIIALVGHGSVEDLRQYRTDGTQSIYGGVSQHDFVNVPEGRTEYANVYSDSSMGYRYEDREAADNAATDSERIGVIEFHFQGGKLVDVQLA